MNVKNAVYSVLNYGLSYQHLTFLTTHNYAFHSFIKPPLTNMLTIKLFRYTFFQSILFSEHELIVLIFFMVVS